MKKYVSWPVLIRRVLYLLMSYVDLNVADNGSVAYSFQLRITERPESKTTAVPFQLPFGDHIVALTPPNYDNM